MAEVEPELRDFAAEAASEKVKEWMVNAEREPPYVKSYNVWGAKHDVDRLVTSEGWKRLREWGAANGFVLSESPTSYRFALRLLANTCHSAVAIGYEEKFGEYKRIVQHAKSVSPKIPSFYSHLLTMIGITSSPQCPPLLLVLYL